ncbi:hypothetical protein [Maricaulis sp.]|uniref:hypothetical protein n=1 Tax=Maricaulis sp. TaxID=1486257 RepID=UPI00261AE108|nr:hypothetical protein [Maricaulis sp.]
MVLIACLSLAASQPAVPTDLHPVDDMEFAITERPAPVETLPEGLQSLVDELRTGIAERDPYPFVRAAGRNFRYPRDPGGYIGWSTNRGVALLRALRLHGRASEIPDEDWQGAAVYFSSDDYVATGNRICGGFGEGEWRQYGEDNWSYTGHWVCYQFAPNGRWQISELFQPLVP